MTPSDLDERRADRRPRNDSVARRDPRDVARRDGSVPAGRVAVTALLAAGPLVYALVGMESYDYSKITGTIVAVATTVGTALASRRLRNGAIWGVAVAAVLLVAGFHEPYLLLYFAGAHVLLAGATTGALPIIWSPFTRQREHLPSASFVIPLVASGALMVLSRDTSFSSIVLGPGVLMLVAAFVAPERWDRVERITAPLVDAALAVHRAVRAAARAIGGLIARIILVIGFVPLVAVPWGVALFSRADTLWAPRGRDTRWVARQPLAAPGTDRLWLPDPVAPGARLHALVRRTIPTLVVSAGLILGIQNTIAVIRARSEDPDQYREVAKPEAPASARTARERMGLLPWHESYAKAYDHALGGAVVDQWAGSNLLETTSPYFNVVDGVRRSWTPPTTCARPLRIWAFGGSAMFGLDQRDRWTIPSEVAKAAWRDGIAVEIRNHAVPGDLSWVELRRLQRALATTTAPPDLVITYDGYNDLRAAEWGAMAGRDPDGQLFNLNDREITPILGRLELTEIDGKRRVVTEPATFADRTDGVATRRAAVAQFTYGHGRTAEVLAARGIPLVAFMQPWVATRRPQVAGDADVAVQAVKLAEYFRTHLPDGVVDVADALDDDPGAHYTDDVHTLETANPPIAARLWSEMQDAVQQVRSGPEKPGC